jgi:rhodanese-related sulfurtransferase
MLLHRHFALLLTAVLALGGASGAAAQSGYNYISAQALEARLMAGEPTNLVDIQVEEEFVRQHIKGALPTYAYPVKSANELGRLDAVVATLQGNADPVVIICPRGGGGATRAYDHLLARGIAAGRLLILEQGQEGWNCAPLTERQ